MEEQQSTDFSLPEEFENQGVLGKFNSWVKNHSRAITSLVIIAVIVGVGIYAYNKPKVEESTTATTEQPAEEVKVAEESKPVIEIAQPNESSATTATSTEAAPVVVERTVETKGEEIVVTAGKGDGVTHLARQALKEYMKADSGVALNAEQKIYVEDYLKDRNVSGRLAMGDSKNFSRESIKQAIDAAKNLNESQIQNLSKYTKMVSELS